MRGVSIAAFAALALAGCSAREPEGPVAVSVIGDAPTLVDPNRQPMDTTDAILVAATAQGLVRFDATGQIEPGLAVRWDVSDDGLYYTFRLASGLRIDADIVARRLRAALARRSRNPLMPVLGAIQEVVAVTPEVVEIRLSSPRPGLLSLLAQPALAMMAGQAGTGPFRIAERRGPSLLLVPAQIDPDEEIGEEERRRREVRLTGERASRAVARFAAGQSALVLGGSYADLAIARARETRPRDRALRFDPAAGLFGLAMVEREGFLADPANRRALAMAIDRDRLIAAFGVEGWRPATALVPTGLEALARPAEPDWAASPFAARRVAAQAIVGLWRDAHGGASPQVRIALPAGPGSRLLFALIRQDLAAVGIEPVLVGPRADADLRLVDAVAPADDPAWYLRRFLCSANPVCSPEADAAMALARAAPTLGERSARLAEADGLLRDAVVFVPLASPLRWSLVAPQLGAFQPNRRAIHPLNHIRAPER